MKSELGTAVANAAITYEVVFTRHAEQEAADELIELSSILVGLRRAEVLET